MCMAPSGVKCTALGLLVAAVVSAAAVDPRIQVATATDPYDVLDAAGALSSTGQLGDVRLALNGVTRVLNTPAMLQQLPPNVRPQVRYNRAFLLQQLGALAVALDEYEAVLAVAPGVDEARVKAAFCAKELGDNARAMQHLRRLVAGPGGRNPQYFLYLGDTLNNLKRFDEAAAAYEQGLKLVPAAAAVQARAAAQLRGQLFTALGDSLMNNKNNSGALAAYQQARALGAQDTALLASLVQCQRELGALRAVDTDERQLLRAVERELAAGQHSAMSPYQGLFAEMDASLRMNVSASWLRQLVRQGEAAMQPHAQQGADAPSAQLHLCYLSRRFYAYPGTQLLLGVFKRHDRGRVRVSCFGSGPGDDSTERRRLQAECDVFHDISAQNTSGMHSTIHDAHCDVLIDYDGLHDFNNIALLATRPSPVQATWLGFAGTTGSDHWSSQRPIDFYVTDRVITPLETSAALLSEALWLLPGSYQPQDPDQDLSAPRPTIVGDRDDSARPRPFFEQDRLHSNDWRPGIATPATTDNWAVGSADAAAVAEDGLFVIACFNRWSKIDAATLTTWMGILQRAPSARLWLYGGHDANASMQLATDPHVVSMQRLAAAYGVHPSRLVFAPKVPRAQHLSRHFDADLMLDTFVYGAHTTTADALYTGLPAISRTGASIASRVGASLLHAAGTGHVGVTATSMAYADAAVTAAQYPRETRALRAELHGAVQEACVAAGGRCGCDGCAVPEPSALHDAVEVAAQPTREVQRTAFRPHRVAAAIEARARASMELRHLCHAAQDEVWRSSLCGRAWHVV